MTELAPPNDIDLRRGFRRAGTTLFWLSAAVVAALWAAQKAGLVALGALLGPIGFVILLVGFTASSIARMLGLALETVARSSLAKDGAAHVSGAVARLGWLPRFALNFVPGASLLTAADLVAGVRDGSFAETMRGAYQTLGAVLGGGLAGIGAASAGWRWWHGAAVGSLNGWLVVAGIGVGLMIGFMVAAGWIADGFKPPARDQRTP